VQIIASGNLDELEIEQFVADGIPLDAFGVGTRLDVSVDAPYLDCVYKLQEYAGRPRRKRSSGKVTWPGRKQVYRDYDAAGHVRSDTIALADEVLPGRPVLQPVMRAGRRLQQPSLEESCAYARREIETLPLQCRLLRDPEPVAPSLSAGLRELADRVDLEFP
jgi:nicotinate phosphoribosyltransferase